MPSEPIDGSQDGQVVPLRAQDAGTETRTIEATGPAAVAAMGIAAIPDRRDTPG